MGKATILSHLGAGQYSILYTPEIGESTARIAELEVLKTALDAQLYSSNGLVEARSAAETVYNNATAAFDVALSDWAACASTLPPCADQIALMQTVMQRGTARAEAGRALTVIRSAIAENRSQYYAVTQEIAYLNSTKNGSGGGIMSAWCIDYDPESIIPASSVVGTVETYGAKGGYAGGYLPRKWINVQTSAEPDYAMARDHCVKPLSAIKTAAMFYNWCQWLYVMSRNPQHAVGVVQAKFSPSQTYLDVELFGTTPGASQPAGYPFVPGESSVMLLNVPVDYLSCGAGAFEAGDLAIVRFSGVNRADPTVIGFASNPADCPSCAHGLVYNGRLYVGGVDTAAWPQPSGGDVDIVRPPTATSYSTIVGTKRQTCRTDLSMSGLAWIYAPAIGNSFKLVFTALTCAGNASGGGFTATIVARPYRLPAQKIDSAESRSIDIALTGIGQNQWDGANITPTPIVATQSETGAGVLLALIYNSVPVGWLLLETTGTTLAGLAIDVSIWKARADCLVRTGDGGTSGGGTLGGPCIGPLFSHNYCAGVSTSFDRAERYIIGAGFTGDTPVPLIAEISQNYVEAYTSSWGCDGIYPDTESESSSGSLAQYDRAEVFFGATSLAWSGYSFSLSGSAPHCAGTTSSLSPAITWRSWDGTETSLTYTSGSYRYFLVPTNYTSVLSDWVSEGTDAALHARYTALFLSATPSECYLSLMTYGAAQVDLGIFGRDSHAAGIKPLGYKLAALVDRISSTSSISKCATPYGLKTTSLALAGWNNQSAIKGSHDPETDDVSMHATVARCYV